MFSTLSPRVRVAFLFLQQVEQLINEPGSDGADEPQCDVHQKNGAFDQRIDRKRRGNGGYRTGGCK